MANISVPLNFEMAATDEMQTIALRHKPHAICLVPERREERTTEGGLGVAQDESRLSDFIAPLREAGCRVSMFAGCTSRTDYRSRSIRRRDRIGSSRRARPRLRNGTNGRRDW